jgi:spermidine synthase
MFNAAVGIWGTWLLLPLIKRNVTIMRVKGFVILVLLAIAFIKADKLTTLAEDALFVDNIIYTKSSSYQRIVVTKGKTGYALFLHGNLQFNSFDEYRYHEALVHPAFASFSGDVKRVLVLGGGDGLALREIEKYNSVEFIQLVLKFPAFGTPKDITQFRQRKTALQNEKSLMRGQQT